MTAIRSMTESIVGPGLRGANPEIVMEGGKRGGQMGTRNENEDKGSKEGESDSR